MSKEIDFPPVWLAGFAAAGGVIGRLWPVETPANDLAGLVFIGAGLVLMLVAVVQMMLAKTTVIPRRDPDALLMGGVFRISRNPIYLGDALLLTGLYLSWNALIALPLVAVFMAVIARRFIRGEEALMRQHFGEIYDEYASRTRRWI